MSALVIGVDVGLGGALAALRGHDLVVLEDLPTVAVERGSEERGAA